MSYLQLLKEIESNEDAYRRALRLFWRHGDEQVYQSLIRLLDDLGTDKAQAIQRAESLDK
jgi:hypothetical protein